MDRIQAIGTAEGFSTAGPLIFSRIFINGGNELHHLSDTDERVVRHDRHHRVGLTLIVVKLVSTHTPLVATRW